MLQNTATESIGVTSLNVLYDKTRTESGLIEPQHERIDSIARTLGSLPVAHDVVLLQEVHVTADHHNGERLADTLQLENRYWFPHNRKGEYLGVCGNKVEAAEDFDIGDRRRAFVAWVGDIAFVGIHHRSGIQNGQLRAEQMNIVLDVINQLGADKVVIGGDANDIARSKSRQLLTDAGFTSVYKAQRKVPLVPNKLPATFPTENYRDILLSPQQRRLLPRGVSIDILETRGFARNEIKQAGTVMTEKSDHWTLYTELETKGVTYE